MENVVNNLEFYKNKKVLVTGHTGFKGTWLCEILTFLGAEVSGYALPPQTDPNIFDLTQTEKRMNSIIGDIRDLQTLEKVFQEVKPEIVFHLAAQPIVRESYKNPVETYETNVMGTVNVLECVRKNDSVKSFLNVTTDKVYENKEWCWGYRETDPLDGYDPYSNSKSCSELVTHSYKKSFLKEHGIAISTARAGNVIGGGDFSIDRIIPDCIRAAESNEPILVRNPYSIRPYQHVLEPLFAYLLIAEKQYNDIKLEGYYNVGPDEKDCITTGNLVSLFCEKWSEDIKWQNCNVDGPHEAGFLKLDCSKIKMKLGWKPCWDVEMAIEKTVEWEKKYINKEDLQIITIEQIRKYTENVNG